MQSAPDYKGRIVAIEGKREHRGASRRNFDENFFVSNIFHTGPRRRAPRKALGSVYMTRWIEYRVSQPEQYSDFMRRARETLRLFNKPFASWHDDIALFMGPRQAGYSAVDVDDLTEVEFRSHDLMAAHLEIYLREAPGFHWAHLLPSARQLGVRLGRRLVSVKKVTRP